MFIHLFITVPLAFAALSLVVVAILTHRADRREVVERANDAYLLSVAFISFRIEEGYYSNADQATIKKDFDNKYIELITT